MLKCISEWLAHRAKKYCVKDIKIELNDSGIGAEAPIRAASQDCLRRVNFAERIANVLSETNLSEGRVFAIRGGWGFGKSSLKNLITEKLDAESDGADWLDFNPWQWGDSDAIARALFSQIADRLGSEHSKAALARARALRRYGAALTGSSAPLKKAGNKSGAISAILTNGSVIAIASAISLDIPTVAKVAAFLALLSVSVYLLGSMLSYLGRDRSGDSLDKIREALESRLQELERPLIVFVDDIDRLEPDQIRMLLRQVKANANLPNIIFVLLFQPSIVEQALEPIANGDGRAFLEKIVQISFDLPAVPVATVHNILGMELSKVAGAYATEANGFSHQRWGNAFAGCIQPLVRNLRDSRRLISSIAAHLPMHLADDVFEVNIVDFLVLETLRVFEPRLHEILFQERELLLQERRFQGDGKHDADKIAAGQLLEIVSESRRTIIQDILKDLFPSFEQAYGRVTYDSGFRSIWLAQKRICTSRYFPRYFELQTAVGEMSERRFVEFLGATADERSLSESINGIEADCLLPSLAARLDESVDRLPVDNAAVLLPGMFRIAEKLAGLGEADPFSSPWLSAWRSTSWFLAKIPREQNRDLFLKALLETRALTVAVILIHLNDPSDQPENRTGTFNPSLSVEDIEKIKSEWLRLIRGLAENDDSLKVKPDIVSLLYGWRKYSGSLEEPRAWVSQAIKNDEDFVSMVARMVSRGTSHSAGDRVATPLNKFNRETIADFIGIDVAKTRCDAINPAEYPEHEEILRTLHTSLEVWLGLREPSPLDLPYL